MALMASQFFLGNTPSFEDPSLSNIVSDCIPDFLILCSKVPGDIEWMEAATFASIPPEGNAVIYASYAYCSLVFSVSPFLQLVLE